MHILSGNKGTCLTFLLALLLLTCFSATTYAAADNVTIIPGVVMVEGDTVFVVIGDPQDRNTVIPSNGHGLLKSGHIGDGQTVRVKIVSDKGHKHRGHVTILK